MIVRGLAVLALLWLLVTWAGNVAASKKATAGRLAQLVTEADFADWSEGAGSAAEGAQRREALEEIAEVLNRLDLSERERMREEETGMRLFEKLTAEERAYFVDLTLTRSMQRMMEAFDQMEPAERKKFVQRAMKNMENGRDEDDLARLESEDPALVDKMVSAGMQAYYEEASAETKLDLAPLMDAFSKMMQGFARGPGGGGP